MSVTITAYDLARRFLGLHEIAGATANPQVLAMLRLDQTWPEGDEVPWCSAFVNYICWLVRLPRTKDLRARSWLTVGTEIPLEQARPDADVVILERGPEAGHVGFFAGLTPDGARVQLLGGNQGNAVSIQAFPVARVLGVRRLA